MNACRYFPVVIALCILVATPLVAEPIQLRAPYEPWPEADAVVERVMDEQRIVGCAIGLIRDHEVVYLQGYGIADKRTKTPVTRETSFRWASISKPLTAIAALQLWEAGKLDLDRDIRDTARGPNDVKSSEVKSPESERYKI